MLTHVDFSDCPVVTDAGVIELGKYCSQLKRLHLHGCNDITDASVDALAEHCVHLELVDLRKCPQATHKLWPTSYRGLIYKKGAAQGFISVLSVF